MTEPEDARRREDASIRTEQRLLDFIEQYKEDKKVSLEWREKIENRLKPLEDFAAPAKKFKTIAYLIIGSFVTVFGYKFVTKTIEWLYRIVQGPHP